MKLIDKIHKTCLYLMTAGGCVHVMGTSAVAASEPAADWRGSYDEVMLWINAGILFFVMYKYGREPLMNFLRGQKKEVADEIQQVEDEKEKLTTKIKETFTELEKSEARFEEMKQKVVRQGEKKKQEIIEDARRQSEILLEASKQKVESQLLQAKSKFKSELVDAAIAMATEKLPAHLTDEDNDQLMENYLTGAMKS